VSNLTLDIIADSVSLKRSLTFIPIGSQFGPECLRCDSLAADVLAAPQAPGPAAAMVSFQRALGPFVPEPVDCSGQRTQTLDDAIAGGTSQAPV